MVLCELAEGRKGCISSVNVEGGFAKRLRDMGFCEGEEVVCIRRAAFSSPILFSVKNSRIALRKDDAKMIEVRA